jgi:hypothetical protein
VLPYKEELECARRMNELELEEQALMVEEQKVRLQISRMELSLFNLKACPHQIYRPMLSHDGFVWVATIEANDGSRVEGRGDCPQAAYNDFDHKWMGVPREDTEDKEDE